MILNPKLLAEQDVSLKQEKRLVELYEELKPYLDGIGDNVVENIERIEYELQDNWNFDRDKTKHSYWYQVKGCTCPKLDNAENWGVDQRVINLSCKWHGEKDN